MTNKPKVIPKIRNYYTFGYKIKLILWLVRTKIFYPKASLIKFPFDIRSKRFIDLGRNIKIGVGARFEAFSQDSKTKTLICGDNIQINDYVHITAMRKVKIGNNVLMAGKIYISDCTHGFYADESTPPHIPPVERPYDIKSVIIGDNVWIGEGVCILPGTVIGDGCIVGANAVVKGVFEENSVIVGVPARVIKKYNADTCRWEKYENQNIIKHNK
ncbi:MAG: acetyltransferase [Bacteroidales bacterium]|jgi:lipopolysaccharide O-acetyltransferase|nr:acetyltransferase [Bacteroidales bacterium]